MRLGQAIIRAIVAALTGIWREEHLFVREQALRCTTTSPGIGASATTRCTRCSASEPRVAST